MVTSRRLCAACMVGVLSLIAFGSVSRADDTVDSIAEAYVKLTLKIGLYDSNYVDYYFGPEEWSDIDTASAREEYPLSRIALEANLLADRLKSLLHPRKQSRRVLFLQSQLRAARGFVDLLQGGRMPFDQESEILYDVVAPPCNYAHYDSLKREMESMLPVEDGVTIDLRDYLSRFMVPRSKVDTILRTAMDKTRSITSAGLHLPLGERLTLELVSNKPWGGFCTYQGEFNSLVQVNVDNPKRVSSLYYLICHEAYPGHHTNFVLIERHLVKDSGWVEYTVGPLYTPSAVISEGIATYASEFVLPRPGQLQFARDVLFPLADLDTAEAGRYFDVIEIRDELWSVEMDIARNYLDGRIGPEDAKTKLIHYLGVTYPEAHHQIEFYDTYHSYIVTYYMGLDLVRNYIEVASGAADDRQGRWEAFSELLRSPVLPSELGHQAPDSF